jgi:hypothetical protein
MHQTSTLLRARQTDRSTIWSDTKFFFFSKLAGFDFGYCGHYWRIVPAPDDRWGWLWRNWWNEEWQGETEVLGENLPQSHFVHHKSHTRPRVWTRAAIVGSQRLTAWAMARPDTKFSPCGRSSVQLEVDHCERPYALTCCQVATSVCLCNKRLVWSKSPSSYHLHSATALPELRSTNPQVYNTWLRVFVVRLSFSRQMLG